MVESVILDHERALTPKARFSCGTLTITRLVTPITERPASVPAPMENPKQLSGKQRLNKPFMWLVIAAGMTICAYSAYRFPVAQVDMELLVLVAVTVIFGSRIGIEIPHVKAEITVSDTFIFLIF